MKHLCFSLYPAPACASYQKNMWLCGSPSFSFVNLSSPPVPLLPAVNANRGGSPPVDRSWMNYAAAGKSICMPVSTMSVWQIAPVAGQPTAQQCVPVPVCIATVAVAQARCMISNSAAVQWWHLDHNPMIIAIDKTLSRGVQFEFRRGAVVDDG